MPRLSPPSNDGRYGKPDASVTGSTHANHRSARSRRLTPEGPARDNPIAGPRSGTTRSEPSAPASARASGRHNEPGSRPASPYPRSRPVKPGAQAPGVGKGTRASGRTTRAPEATGPDEAQRTNAGQRGKPERHAAGHNQGTRTGAKERRPPGATNPESTHNANKPRHRYGCQATANPHTTHPSQEWRGAAKTRA